MSFLMNVVAPDHPQAGNTTMLTVGVSLLLEGLVTMAKASRSEYRIPWDKRRDGAARPSLGRPDQQRPDQRRPDQ
ncbi:hypothetical protein [Amycolatopsis sulphurea]|nr:hypothetical protein [Amycolatopsis sulphurea]